MSQGWDIKDLYKNTSRDDMPESETITTYGDRLVALAQLNISEHGGSKTTVNGKSVYRINTEKPANVEPLPDLKKQYAAMRSQLRAEVEKGVVSGASAQEKARAAYLAICLDFAAEMKEKHAAQWTARPRCTPGVSARAAGDFLRGAVSGGRQNPREGPDGGGSETRHEPEALGVARQFLSLPGHELNAPQGVFMKRLALLSFLGAVLTCGLARAQNPAVTVQGYHIMGPATSADFPRWIADMKRWRMEYLKRIGYSGSEYDRPELKWAQSSFMQPQMMVEDRYFYDPVAGKYTVDRYLDDLDKRYGGIDAVLVWHTYPISALTIAASSTIFRDLPGGIAGIKQMVADFHRRGVRVLFPMMLWDQGTRDFGVTGAAKPSPKKWPRSARMESTATPCRRFREHIASPRTRPVTR